MWRRRGPRAATTLPYVHSPMFLVNSAISARPGCRYQVQTGVCLRYCKLKSNLAAKRWPKQRQSDFNLFRQRLHQMSKTKDELGDGPGRPRLPAAVHPSRPRTLDIRPCKSWGSASHLVRPYSALFQTCFFVFDGSLAHLDCLTYLRIWLFPAKLFLSVRLCVKFESEVLFVVRSQIGARVVV